MGKIINTVIFDLGMVLVDFNWKKCMEKIKLTDEIYKKIADSLFLSELREEYDRSLISDEEIIDMFTKDIPECRQEFIEVFKNEGEAIEVFEYTLEWIKELKAKNIKTYVLSNYARNTYNLTKDKLSFVDDMDGAVFSWQVNKIKPEKEIYEILLNKYKLEPSECVFIDDRQINLDGAAKFGINTILFTSKKEVDRQLEQYY